jgi:hypothetical protein
MYTHNRRALANISLCTSEYFHQAAILRSGGQISFRTVVEVRDVMLSPHHPPYLGTLLPQIALDDTVICVNWKG